MQSCGPFPVDPGSIPRGLVGGPCEPWVPVLRQDNPHGLLAFLVAPPPAPETACRLLLDEERAYAASLQPRRNREWTAGRVCLAHALAAFDDARGATPSRRMPLLRAPNGAVEAPPGAVCSIAHKGRFFVALVAHDRGQRVGVDLEHVGARDVQLAKRILTGNERAVVENLVPADRARGVAVHFALKEAVYKALKPEAQGGLEHCEIGVTGWSPSGGSVWQEVEVRVRRELGKSHMTARVLSVDAWVLCTATIHP